MVVHEKGADLTLDLFQENTADIGLYAEAKNMSGHAFSI